MKFAIAIVWICAFLPSLVMAQSKSETAVAPSTPPQTILQPGESPIDLATALKLAGAENPELLQARQRVLEATALRQFAAVQLLPNLNLGSSYNNHQGPLQQSSGNILSVNRESMYVGFGAIAIGGGTVNIPGLNYNLNVGAAWYGYLISRQRVQSLTAASEAVRNDVTLRVSLAYFELLRAETKRAIALTNRAEGAEIARLTAEYARAGQGKKSDADRAAVELQRRDLELTQAEADTLIASARLCQLLNLDPAVRLKTIDGFAVPSGIVPDAIPLPELLAMAVMSRPELSARRYEVQQTIYELSLAKVLPFSPNAVLGFSAGGFGGGSNLVADAGGSRFSSLNGRSDFDVALFWTFRNLGVGNVALYRAADSRVKQIRFRELETLNLVRSEVAEALARSAARVNQIDSAEKAVRASTDAYREDLIRIKGGQGLPLEIIDSMRLLARSRNEYLDAIIDYNRAQVQLWVSLGCPAADGLVRPVPAADKAGPRVFTLPPALPGATKP